MMAVRCCERLEEIVPVTPSVYVGKDVLRVLKSQFGDACVIAKLVRWRHEGELFDALQTPTSPSGLRDLSSKIVALEHELQVNDAINRIELFSAFDNVGLLLEEMEVFLASETLIHRAMASLTKYPDIGGDTGRSGYILALGNWGNYTMKHLVTLLLNVLRLHQDVYITSAVLSFVKPYMVDQERIGSVSPEITVMGPNYWRQDYHDLSHRDLRLLASAVSRYYQHLWQTLVQDVAPGVDVLRRCGRDLGRLLPRYHVLLAQPQRFCGTTWHMEALHGDIIPNVLSLYQDLRYVSRRYTGMETSTYGLSKMLYFYLLRAILPFAMGSINAVAQDVEYLKELFSLAKPESLPNLILTFCRRVVQALSEPESSTTRRLDELLDCSFIDETCLSKEEEWIPQLKYSLDEGLAVLASFLEGAPVGSSTHASAEWSIPVIQEIAEVIQQM